MLETNVFFSVTLVMHIIFMFKIQRPFDLLLGFTKYNMNTDGSVGAVVYIYRYIMYA